MRSRPAGEGMDVLDRVATALELQDDIAIDAICFSAQQHLVAFVEQVEKLICDPTLIERLEDHELINLQDMKEVASRRLGWLMEMRDDRIGPAAAFAREELKREAPVKTGEPV